MSPIPSLPTDNLYKFCSVAGCLAFVIAGLTTFQAWRDILAKQWSIESQASEQRSQKLDMEIGEMMSKPWAIPTEGDTPEAAALRKKLEDKAEQMKPIYEESQKKLAGDREKLASASYDFIIFIQGAGIFALIGIVVAGYGFWNWRAIQLMQDRLLQLELSEKIQSHESSSRSVGSSRQHKA